MTCLELHYIIKSVRCTCRVWGEESVKKKHIDKEKVVHKVEKYKYNM